VKIESSHAAASGSEPLAEPAADARQAACDETRYAAGPEIGRGGMGLVMQAHDLRLDRTVALKEELRPGRGRIEREARITARLEHPGIVPIHDIGQTADGRFFFAMRLVRGRSLARLIAEAGTASEPGPIAAQQRLVRSVLAAAEAVAYAHHLGVVHRDLKPGNIMVGAFGETQVVDWGLARHVDDPLDPAERGVLVGTPSTMAPETVEGRVGDKRSDVWSLGCILYDVACGRPAFDGQDRDAVLERVQLASWSPPTELGRELQAILARAMAADPNARYADAKAFADDLARWLDGKKVAAYTYRTRDLLRRFGERHRVALVVAMVALVALVTLGIVAVVDVLAERAQAIQARAESDRHLARALVGEAQRSLAIGACAEAEVLAAEALVLSDDPEALGVLAACAAGPRPERLGVEPLPADCAEPDIEPAGRFVLCSNPGNIAVWDRETRAFRWRLPTTFVGATFQAGGREVVVTGTALGDRVLATRDGALLGTGAATSVRPSAGGDGPAIIVSGDSFMYAASPTLGLAAKGFAPCGDTTLAVAAHAGDWIAWCRTGVVITARGRVFATPFSGLHDEPTALALADGEVIVGTNHGALARIDLRDGAVRARSEPIVEGVVRAIEPAPGGELIVVLGERGGAVLVDRATLTPLARFPADAARRVRFVGADLITFGTTLERWRVADGRPRVLAAPGGVTSVELDGAGALLVAHGASVTERDARGRVAVTLGWQPHIVKGAAWSGANIVAASVIDTTVVRYERATGALLRRDDDLQCRRVVGLSDGSVLLGGYSEGVVRMWPAGERVRVDDVALDVAVTGGRYASWIPGADRALVLYDAATHTSVSLGFNPGAVASAPSGLGDAVYVASGAGVGRYDERGLQHWFEGHGELVEVQVSADDRLVAAGARDGRVFVWDTADGALRLVSDAHRERVPTLAFDPAGRFLASGSWDGTVRLLDLSVLVGAPPDLRARAIAWWGRSMAQLM